MDASFKVLLIEPDDLDAELIEGLFARSGLHCRIDRIKTVENLKLSIRHLKPDVIVCELQIPGSFGFEVLKTCRSVAPDIPFIFVADMPRRFDAEVAKRLGAMALLDRASVGQLLVTLRNALNIAIARTIHQGFQAIA